MKKVVFYSQNREDLYINAFFPDVKQGFYIDIGAFDPTYHSVTKLFYNKGWSGINVEPQEYYIDKLKRDRPRDINIHAGVSDKRGNLVLRDYKGGGLSTFSKKMKEEYEADEKMKNIIFKDYSVEVITINDVFSKVPKGRKVNFLKVDVEGLEYEVFSGNDWQKNRPELICVESNHIGKDWKALLKESGYVLAFFDGLNEYYLASESSHRKKMFDFPAMFLKGKEVIPYDLDWQLKKLKNELKSTYKRILELEKEIDILHEETKGLYNNKSELENKIVSLEFHLHEIESRRKSIRYNTKQVISSLKNRADNIRKGKK